MWPSEQTLLLLLLGLLPPAYVVGLAVRRGQYEIATLRATGVLFLWVGYHFSPWLAYSSRGDWRAFPLVRGFIDDGLLFSTLCMAAFLVGYEWVERRGRVSPVPAGSRNLLLAPQVKLSWLFTLSLLSLLLLFVSAGGLDEVWRASTPRGSGQWGARDLAGKIQRMAAVVGGIFVDGTLACAGSLYVLRYPRKPLTQLPGWLALFVASLRRASEFSRAAGFTFLIFAFLALRTKGKRSWLIVACTVLLAYGLGSTGLYLRGSYYPGLGNYSDAVADRLAEFDRSERPALASAEGNPLDAMARWTRKSLAREEDRPDPLEMTIRFLLVLGPFPSELFPIPKLGDDLSELLGTYGKIGITTPALGELHYAFSWMGALVMLPLGAFSAWLERRNQLRPSLLSSLCVLLGFLAFGVGLHSGIRAMTRPLLYAAIAIFVSEWIRRRRSSALPPRTVRSRLPGR